MSIAVSRNDAQRIVNQLMNSPIAPGGYSHFINVGTDAILDTLEHNYFRGHLADGISCFKYLEGDYGSGKTQFILSLAQRAHQNDVVTSVVSIGSECPFNSQSAIYRAVVESFVPADSGMGLSTESKGIELLLSQWIVSKLREMGVESGKEVPAAARNQIERSFKGLWVGAPDQQMAQGLTTLGDRLLSIECGASSSLIDTELVQWIRGANIKSKVLRDHGLHEPVKDENAFRRLKTVIAFLRTRLGCKGFFIAFDEGSRTASFRRGSVKQKQAIENMLTMINENADGQFGGVMFLYSATPDFRSDVIAKSYTALNDRIGSVAMSAGSPMVPLIDLERYNSDDVTRKLGEKLLDVFEIARGGSWNRETQLQNMLVLVEQQKEVLVLLDKVPPRLFVYQYCRFLDQQWGCERQISEAEAASFVSANDLERAEDQ